MIKAILNRFNRNRAIAEPSSVSEPSVPDLSAIIKAAMPRVSDDWIPVMNEVFNQYGIAGDEAALLLAHIGHESSDLNRLEENLNYSAERLMQVWPFRFRTIDVARQYERNPQALANNVYGGRMGNTSPNDGWWFRGRGPMQITGRDNYTRLANDTRIKVLSDPNLLITDKRSGIISACWFWRTYVNSRTLDGSTRQINGGTNGLADRRNRYDRARAFV
jgi:putative chitinase